MFYAIADRSYPHEWVEFVTERERDEWCDRFKEYRACDGHEATMTEQLFEMADEMPDCAYLGEKFTKSSACRPVPCVQLG